jgi:16S rRNA (cytosine1402-N4)-methyltransferase
MVYRHAPIMVREAAELLKPENGKKFLDGTLGGGGHAEELLERSGPAGRLLGLDWDEEAVTASRERLHRFGDRFISRQANFTEAKEILRQVGWAQVDGILLDLGLSSHQLDSRERGFSFQGEAKLDMRMDRRRSLDAYRIVNTFPVPELERIFRDYGEEPHARRIAFAIDRRRRTKPIETTGELAALVAQAARKPRSHIHPATKIFQALRIAVNRELENLSDFLEGAYALLVPQGRMAVISFHSLEDRLVKRTFVKWSRSCLCPPRTPVCRCGWSQKVRLLTRRPLVPTAEEIQRNPRARSAKLRAVERL